MGTAVRTSLTDRKTSDKNKHELSHSHSIIGILAMKSEEKVGTTKLRLLLLTV
jgi:hypothetical protein